MCKYSDTDQCHAALCDEPRTVPVATTCLGWGSQVTAGAGHTAVGSTSAMPLPSFIAGVPWLGIAAVITTNGRAHASPGAVVPYQHEVTAVGRVYCNMYYGGVYSPTLDRVYLLPFTQAPQYTCVEVCPWGGFLVGEKYSSTLFASWQAGWQRLASRPAT